MIDAMSYLTITSGIFVTLAFFIVTFILWRCQINIGPWILISFATLFITISEILRIFNKPLLHQSLLVCSMILLFITALIKYWDTLELTEQN